MFGEIRKEKIVLNPLGLIAQEEWLKTRIIRPELELDEFIIMPNHFHGIVIIKDIPKTHKENMIGTHGHGTHCRASLQRQPRSLGSIIAGFKSAATKRINEKRNMPCMPVWQSRFYEHIIRTDKDLNNIRAYIINNPIQWHEDEDNPIKDHGE